MLASSRIMYISYSKTLSLFAIESRCAKRQGANLMHEILLRGCFYTAAPSRKCYPIKYISSVGLCRAKPSKMFLFH